MKTQTKAKKEKVVVHCDNVSHKNSTITTVCTIKSCPKRFLCDRCVKDTSHQTHRKYFQALDHYFHKDRTRKVRASNEEDQIKLAEAHSIITSKKDMVRSFLIQISDECEALEQKMDKMLDDLYSLFDAMKKEMHSHIKKKRRDFINMFNLFEFFLSRDPGSKLTPEITGYEPIEAKDLMDILLYLDDNQIIGGKVQTPLGEFSTDHTVLQSELMKMIHLNEPKFAEETEDLKVLGDHIAKMIKKCNVKIEHKKFVKDIHKINLKEEQKGLKMEEIGLSAAKKVKKEEAAIINMLSKPKPNIPGKSHPYKVELPLSKPDKRKKAVDSIELIKQTKKIEQLGSKLSHPTLANFNAQAVGFSLRRDNSSKMDTEPSEEALCHAEDLKQFLDFQLWGALYGKQQITMLSYHELDKLFLGFSSGLIEYWNLKANLLIYQFFGHQKPIRGLKLILNEKFLASASSDNTMRIWELATGTCNLILQGHADAVHCFITVEKDTLLISGSEDKTIKFWNTETGECENTFKNNAGSGIYSLCELPVDITPNLPKAANLPHLKPGDGFLFAAASKNAINIWVHFVKFKRDPEILATFKGHDRNIKKVIYWDPSTIISCSVDSTIKVWDLNTEACSRTIAAHATLVNSIGMYGCNLAIVSVGADGYMRFWDPYTGMKLHEVQQHDSIMAVATLDDGKIITGGMDKVVKVWCNSSSRYSLL